jgi:hypothetical protein
VRGAARKGGPYRERTLKRPGGCKGGANRLECQQTDRCQVAQGNRAMPLHEEVQREGLVL